MKWEFPHDIREFLFFIRQLSGLMEDALDTGEELPDNIGDVLCFAAEVPNSVEELPDATGQLPDLMEELPDMVEEFPDVIGGLRHHQSARPHRRDSGIHR